MVDALERMKELLVEMKDTIDGKIKLPPVADEGHEGHRVDNFIPPHPADHGLQNTVKEYPFYTDDMKYHYQKVILFSEALEKARDYAMAEKDALSPPVLDQFGQPIIDLGRYTFMTDDMKSNYQEMTKNADWLEQAYQEAVKTSDHADPTPSAPQIAEAMDAGTAASNNDFHNVA